MNNNNELLNLEQFYPKGKLIMGIYDFYIVANNKQYLAKMEKP